MKARDVMTPAPTTVSPQHSVRHVAQIMLDRHFSGIPVLDDDGRLVGIVTEGDLLRRAELGTESLISPGSETTSSADRANNYVRANGWKVADVMARDVITVDEETTLGQIVAQMAEHRIKRVPVMRDLRLVGIVSRADLLHGIATAKLDDTAPGDEAVRRSILARLNDEPDLGCTNVTVTVGDGVVHLWGVAESPSSRRAARVVAEGVRGVNGVVDHLSSTLPGDEGVSSRQS